MEHIASIYYRLLCHNAMLAVKFTQVNVNAFCYICGCVLCYYFNNMIEFVNVTSGTGIQKQQILNKYVFVFCYYLLLTNAKYS